MKKLTILLACLGLCSSVFASGAQSSDPVGSASAGKDKSAVCAACHGADGNSPANPLWPKLAGQHASYIVKQLEAFKHTEGTEITGENQRYEPTMTPMAKPLSAQDMADLGAYFSAQPLSIGSTNPDLLEAGEKIYRGGINDKRKIAACMACHGPSGAGNPAANYPSIKGQHAAYVEKALKDFRAGKRSTDPNHMMRDVAHLMSDEEIAAVSSYVNGLH